MTQLKFYQYASIGLLALNIVIIAFFFLAKPPSPSKNAGKQFEKKAIAILHLDDAQQTAFLALAEAHNEKMDAINAQQSQLLEPYFQRLINSSAPLPAENTLQKVQLLKKEKVDVTYHHFEEVKAMLQPEQIGYFKEFMTRALQLLLLKGKG